ncbi:Lar family restriction alleviation protein [Brucella tritici]|uniref:Lar family restriction alleviation protein n=1 Tax=Brucella tritici TaxID=94626 RepID=UPI002000DB1A|nr:Lar family restriction alleviation protein [Brucella tritici]
MASELKPCPFCGGNNLNTYYCDIEGWIAHIKCDDCDDMIGPMSEYKYESQEEAYEDAATRWNTRPAPAATDTGLVTVGGEYLDGHTWKPMPAGVTDFALRGFKTRALCARSQAEELLAAKDADMDQVLADNRRCIVRIAELEADNAAKDARVKELEKELENGGRVKGVNTQYANALAYLEMTEDDDPDEFAKRIWDEREALKAKLAAAQKALEPFANAADGRKSKSVKGAVCFSQHYLLAARAVLGGKPS